MSQQPLCFVIMPFGQKPDPSGGPAIDFDRIYQEAIEPGIRGADMEPIRADEERTGGIIHKPMFERLLLCDYAVADLTTANANVFYELGVRHTARPATTLTIFAKQQPIPFDVNFLRSMPYDLGEKNRFEAAQAASLKEAISKRLEALRTVAKEDAAVDSPLFDLVREWEPGNLARLKTDVFRDQVRSNETCKRTLALIREKHKVKETREAASEELAAFRQQYRDLDALEAATVIDIMLTYRALEDWSGMIVLYEEMPVTLKRQILVREQLGFAYNRRAKKGNTASDRANALSILDEVEKQQGASSETCGLIGRVHKDNWSDALASSDKIATAVGHLNKSIAAYRRGYLADPRDTYPGINLVTLLDVKGDDKSLDEKARLVPVVRFAAEQRMSSTEADYWDHATLLELAVLDDDETKALDHLANAVAVIRETWEPGTTANNLAIIERARHARGLDTEWLGVIIEDLNKRAK